MSKNLEMYDVSSFKDRKMEITNVLSDDYFTIRFEIADDILLGVDIEDGSVIFAVDVETDIRGQNIFRLEFENKTITVDTELNEIK